MSLKDRLYLPWSKEKLRTGQQIFRTLEESLRIMASLPYYAEREAKVIVQQEVSAKNESSDKTLRIEWKEREKTLSFTLVCHNDKANKQLSITMYSGVPQTWFEDEDADPDLSVYRGRSNFDMKYGITRTKMAEILGKQRGLHELNLRRYEEHQYQEPQMWGADSLSKKSAA